MRTRVPLLISLTLIIFSCSIDPADFWTVYEKNHIVDQQSDQGPWGGTKTIHWETKGQFQFTASEILDFAALNEWTLSSKQVLTRKDLERLYSFDRENIHISFTDLDPEPDTIRIEFPLYIDKDLTIYRFNTSRVLFQLGTDNSTTENGVILVSKDRNEMALYHKWGE